MGSFGIGEFLASSISLGIILAIISWAFYVAHRLRDIGRHLDAMNNHQQNQARNIYVIATALTKLASEAPRETMPATPPAVPPEE